MAQDAHRGGEGDDGGRVVDPERHIAYTLARVAHVMDRMTDAALAGEGLSLRMFGALSHLSGHPGRSSAELARLLLVTPQSMGVLVRRLEAMTYVRRAEPAVKGFAVRLEITPEGEAALARAAELAIGAEGRGLRSLSEAERTTLHALLRRLLTDLAGQDGC
ncbi:MarR family winged helix-turn-helix transcriptional regulator [Streptomyces sp. NPDC058417]|uniref:MarR family winged helix-turn-helix transcriptional regulator n=1 Tax=unclassified Streptomyces TaxID=2593676 RepID=UPI00364C19A5